MSSQSKKRSPLQKIASDILRDVSRGFIDPAAHPDWVASIMRQWVSYDGHAAVLTPTDRFWLKLKKTESGYKGRVAQTRGAPLDGFMKDWNFDAALEQKILADLNQFQVSEFENRDGLALRMRVDPQERRVSLEQVE